MDLDTGRRRRVIVLRRADDNRRQIVTRRAVRQRVSFTRAHAALVTLPTMSAAKAVLQRVHVIMMHKQRPAAL